MDVEFWLDQINAEPVSSDAVSCLARLLGYQWF